MPARWADAVERRIASARAFVGVPRFTTSAAARAVISADSSGACAMTGDAPSSSNAFAVGFITTSLVMQCTSGRTRLMPFTIFRLRTLRGANVCSILIGAAMFYYIRRIRRDPDTVYIRRIPGVDAIEEAVGRSTEMGRPVLYVTGVDETQNIQTVASLLILGHVAEMIAEYDTDIKVANAYPLTMVLAEEIVRQLRLRDIGGIIVIDFIDMVLESNRDLVLRRLTECLGRDRTRHQVAEVTSLGLVQMTRKRVGTGLLEAYSSTCEHCRGRGVLVSTDPVNHSHNGSRRNRHRNKHQEHAPAENGKQSRESSEPAKEEAKPAKEEAKPAQQATAEKPQQEKAQPEKAPEAEAERGAKQQKQKPEQKQQPE